MRSINALRRPNTHPATLRRFTIVAATAALTVTAACGGTGAGPSTAKTGGKVGGSITYTWWGAGERNQKTEAVINLYKKAHPGVKIETSTADFNAYFQKLGVEAAGKNLPCVPQMQARELTDFTSRRALLPLDSLVSSGKIDVSGMPKSVLNTGRGADGKLYMIPTGAAYDGIMYNQTLAKKAGVGDLPPKYTWDQWSKWILTAAKKLPKGVYAANLDGGNADLFISYVQSQGQQLFNKQGQLGFSKQTLVNYWNMWEKLRKAGATVPAATAAELANAQENQAYIVLGKAMSQVTPGNWLQSAQEYLNDNGGGTLKITTHPYGTKGIGNVLITSGLSIAANCNNVATAASFINFFTNDPGGAKAFASDNGAVTDTKLLQSQQQDSSTDPGVKSSLSVYSDIVKAGAPVILYPSGYTAVFQNDFANEYQQISFGKTSVPAGVDAFFKQAKSELQQ